jgi:biotin-(acetyl-CoA carboxylase) ligase
MSLSIDRSKASWPPALAAFSLACAATVAQRLECESLALLASLSATASASASAADAFERAMIEPSQMLWVKWPNDLVRYREDKGLTKLAGILIETRQQAGQSRLVIGLGVNLLLPLSVVADAQALPADALFARDARLVDRLDLDWRKSLARRLSQDLLGCWLDFERNGLAAFESLIHCRDVLRGRRLMVQDEGQDGWVQALGQGIDDRGYLRILCQRPGTPTPRLEVIHQGSVRLRSASDVALYGDETSSPSWPEASSKHKNTRD